MLQQLKNSLEAGGRQEWGFRVKWGMGCSPYMLVKGPGPGRPGRNLVWKFRVSTRSPLLQSTGGVGGIDPLSRELRVGRRRGEQW